MQALFTAIFVSTVSLELSQTRVVSLFPGCPLSRELTVFTKDFDGLNRIGTLYQIRIRLDSDKKISDPDFKLIYQLLDCKRTIDPCTPLIFS